MRGTTLRAATVAVALVALAACGGGSKKSSTTSVTATNNTGAGGTAAGGGATTTSVANTTRQIGKTVEFAGFNITVVDATFTPNPPDTIDTSTTAPAKNPGTLALDVSLQNLTPKTLQPQGEWHVETKGASQPPNDLSSSLQEVPGDGKAPGTIKAALDDFSFDDAVVVFGAADQHQAQVPLGSSGELVTYKDTTQPISGTGTSGEIAVKLTNASTRSYGPARSGYGQAKKGKVYLVVDTSVSTTSQYGFAFSDSNVSLTEPDGTALIPDEALSANGGCCEDLNQQAPMKYSFTFAVTDPPSGKYTFFVINGSKPKAPIPFTLS
ncbi:MAG TPA: hypothetical protein VN636_07565 [Acidimicrobiia bacterium]|nr:hypothetical protein [Acidimicrobiia bacterium]